jgi:oligopeptidase A
VASVHDALEEQLTEFQTERYQHRVLFDQMTNLAKKIDAEEAPDSLIQRVLSLHLQSFRLAGVHLDTTSRNELQVLFRDLTRLGSQFEQNLMKATDAFSLHLEDDRRLTGIPPSFRSLYRQAAEDRGLQGYVITLHRPSYLGVMMYAQDRTLRETLYRSYVTRASDRGTAPSLDNTSLMVALLEKRKKLASLLGFPSYAHYALTPKMADSPQQVAHFLEEISTVALPKAQREWAEMAQFATQQGLEGPMEAWDVLYVSERMRESRLALDQEEIKSFFPLESTLERMMQWFARTLGFHFQRTTPLNPYHEDVVSFVLEKNNRILGELWCDLYAREGKHGGAWMDVLRHFHSTPNGDLWPVAGLFANGTPPCDGAPSLLTHEDVLTLLHELGHCLHHLFSHIPCASVAGTNGVEWDAVELPSQLLENWGWEPSVLSHLSSHVVHGRCLDLALGKQLQKSRRFQSGLRTIRQLEFALVDLKLHGQTPPTDANALLDLHRGVREAVSLFPYLPEDRFLWGFSHIFGGGYASGYYSYLWAEQLSSDAFGAFLAHGLGDPATGAMLVKEILEPGGSRPALTNFKAFRGREPDPEAFFRLNGLKDEEPS